jgi:hypothetical protein
MSDGVSPQTGCTKEDFFFGLQHGKDKHLAPRIPSSLKLPDLLWSLPAPYSVGTGVSYSGGKDLGVKLNIHVRVLSRLRINGAIPPLPHLLSYLAQR